jgi:drug/metabolite transporter (DMT)-like permease
MPWLFCSSFHAITGLGITPGNDLMRNLSGAVLVIISAIAFGCMPLFAIYAYDAGVDPVTLLFLRFLMAGSLMLAVMLAKKIPFPRGPSLAGLVGMGALGYVGQSLCYFNALTLASAGLVALLLYLYPALVTAFSALIFREPITRAKITALLLALCGAVLVIGPGGEAQPLGIILGLGAAFIYSLYILAGNRILKDVPAFPSSAVIMMSAGAAFGLLAAYQGLHLPVNLSGWMAVFGLTIVSTIIAILTFMAGMQRVGPTNAALLSTLEPVVTLALAALLLGESLTLFKLAGGGLILAAVLILTKGSGAPSAEPPLPLAKDL